MIIELYIYPTNLKMTIKDRIVKSVRSILPGTLFFYSLIKYVMFLFYSGGGKKNKGENADFEKLKEEVTIDEHKITLEEVVARFETNIEQGHTTEKARELLEKNGPNALTPPAEIPEWVKFCKLLFGGFSALLWVSYKIKKEFFFLNI